MKAYSQFSVRLLWSLLVLSSVAARADFAPRARLLGPDAPGRESYDIGREHLKLKAFVVESTDHRDIRDAVEGFRKSRGTHDWDWKINYVSLKADQALVLSWYNLDASESGWTAVSFDRTGRWLKMTNREEKWVALRGKNLIRRQITHGHSVVSRISDVRGGRVAFAFSRNVYWGERFEE